MDGIVKSKKKLAPNGTISTGTNPKASRWGSLSGMIILRSAWSKAVTLGVPTWRFH